MRVYIFLDRRRSLDPIRTSLLYPFWPILQNRCSYTIEKWRMTISILKLASAAIVNETDTKVINELINTDELLAANSTYAFS